MLPSETESLTLRRAIAPVPRRRSVGDRTVGDRAIGDRAEGRDWLSFTDPVETIVAWNLDEVVPALEKVEAAAADGLWAVGFVSYDAGPAFDPAIASHRASGTPLLAFGLFADAQPDVFDPEDQPGAFATGPWTPSVDQDRYEAGVRKVKEHIAAGDTYQVNLTLRLHATFDGDPLGLFRALARSQRGDHLVYLDFGSHALCSASPELFFRRSPLADGGAELFSKPMKGTRGRSPDPAEDAELACALVASEKDRAENTMIVDMMRNDFGRIARIGTVQVPDLHVVESYPTVHQMVSSVTAETDASLTEVFTSTFPPASITGAPKVSTSRIITSLEEDGRGSYCGAAGLVAPDGRAEFNVAIRSVWIDRTEGLATYGTGGGIVWDSDPTEEWFETRTKTRVLESAPAPFELFETMLYNAGGPTIPGITLLDRHLARLASSAERFGFDLDLDEIRHRLQTIEARSPQRVRLVVGPDGSVSIATVPINPSIGDPWVVPIDRAPDGRSSVESSDLFLRHKTTHRRVYDEARARYPQSPDVILWNERGELTETTIGNLVIDIDGQLLTPARHCGLLPGTFRAELLAHNKIIEEVIVVEQIAAAREIFLINSVRGWVPLEVQQ